MSLFRVSLLLKNVDSDSNRSGISYFVGSAHFAVAVENDHGQGSTHINVLV